MLIFVTVSLRLTKHWFNYEVSEVGGDWGKIYSFNLLSSLFWKSEQSCLRHGCGSHCGPECSLLAFRHWLWCLICRLWSQAGLGWKLELDGSYGSGFLNLPCSNSPPQKRRQSEARGCTSSLFCQHLTSSPGKKVHALNILFRSVQV